MIGRNIEMKKSRKKQLSGCTSKIKVGCGTMYVTVNEDDGIPFEVFATLGKGGGCAAAQIEGISRLASLALRCGASCDDVIRQLCGISCHAPVTADGVTVRSCADAISNVLITRREQKGGEI